MAFTLIEWMALIVALIAILKIIAIFAKPKAWMDFAEKVYQKPLIVMIVAVILGFFALRELLAVMTMTQIFAVIFFIAMLGALTMTIYAKEMLALGRKMLNDKKILQKAWLPIAIWLVLSLWALKELFGL
jgi:hypothetical protein